MPLARLSSVYRCYSAFTVQIFLSALFQPLSYITISITEPYEANVRRVGSLSSSP